MIQALPQKQDCWDTLEPGMLHSTLGNSLVSFRAPFPMEPGAGLFPVDFQ